MEYYSLGKQSANVDFKIENIESINVNENAFLPSIPENERYTILLKG